MRRAFFIVAAVGVGLVGVGAFALIAPNTGEKEAILAAGPAAMALGFDLAKLPSPFAAGSSIWGTKSFHWEASSGGGVVNRLSYLVSDERLCWTSQRQLSSQDHGCVEVKAPT